MVSVIAGPSERLLELKSTGSSQSRLSGSDSSVEDSGHHWWQASGSSSGSLTSGHRWVIRDGKPEVPRFAKSDGKPNRKVGNRPTKCPFYD